jgi:hypothetical protein
MARKFIYYMKGFSRTIVITDNDDSVPIEEITSKISKTMSGNRVSEFETSNDILIVRPQDIAGIHIVKDSSEQDSDVSEELEEGINLQNIVPEIDLGDIEDSDNINDIHIDVDNDGDVIEENYELEKDFDGGDDNDDS